MQFRTESSVSAMNSFMFFLFFFSLLLLSRHHCAEVYEISPAQPPSEGQTLVSPRHVFELGFFSPNNNSGNNKYVGIWHKSIFPRKVVWVANREKPIAASDTLASLRISSKGNLELVDGKQNPLWSTNISVLSNGSAASLLDTGNFVVKDDVGAEPLWQSFDYPSDTFLPSMRLGFNSKSGETNFLTSWKSESDPSTGMFMVGLTPEVPSQIVIWINGSTPYWRTGPWDKSTFIGLPGTNDAYTSGLRLDDNAEEGTKYYSYNSYNYGDVLEYSDISSDGTLQFMNSEHGENWILDFVAQNNSCDKYAACGPFGVCKRSESPRRMEQRKQHRRVCEEWSKGNSTGGCVRQTKLFCETHTSQSVTSRRNEDGFSKMTQLKVPDFHEYIKFSDAQKCRTQCLKNCSCLAYAHVDNIGCLVWSKDLLDIQEFAYGGEDLFIRLDRSELGEGKPIKLIASLAAICLISILGALGFGFHRLQANNKKGNARLTDIIENRRDTLQEYIGKHDPSELFIYNFDSILIATNNFSITNKLGEGGFGPVYKGKLQEGKEIAVKRLSSGSGQGMEEFKNEVLLISKLQHTNLVRILGCCVKDDEKLLIYEFMPNRSLDTLLFNPTQRAVLDWGRRFNIIQGVARGLLYLHRDSCLRVIHRDLKVSNILLDEKMNPKISDFGLSRIVEAAQSLANTHKIVGTLGYMSPEYIFSEKSDVYSFGVLLLEIIRGRKSTSFYHNEEQLGFLSYAWHLWNEGRGLEFVDEVLADSYSSSEATRCMHIGLLSVQDKAADRPTMLDVVFALSNEKDLPPPKQPIFTNFENSSVYDPHPHDNNIFSVDNATITMIAGR
ncbi:G-type lectin S-receptor-like serine/threonine-protein kinase At1g61550 [Malus sylvestris]|uniref:G-type lectin S-receptor-like serine/threonine-protein kinase At1g61550 n=1 Tax=Malus sylvestris TaxID=3752 RepID=UPI0021AB9F8C|nr:G-type lectin S-receptor-like serine/threonine-protein kinase At1g61550 [Malus sylvestris]